MMEGLFEVTITQGLLPADLVQSLSVNTKCIEKYSPVLQVPLVREHFTLSVQKNTLPIWYG